MSAVPDTNAALIDFDGALSTLHANGADADALAVIDLTVAALSAALAAAEERARDAEHGRELARLDTENERRLRQPIGGEDEHGVWQPPGFWRDRAEAAERDLAARDKALEAAEARAVDNERRIRMQRDELRSLQGSEARAMAAEARAAALAEGLADGPERDYLTRTIATVRNHREADNCWPQWANIFADEIERCWALARDTGEQG